jgi:small conductance mechanosensitive channel
MVIKNIIKAIILIIIFVYVAIIFKKSISNINSGQITSIDENKKTYKKIVNNNDIYGQLSDLVFYSIIIIGLIFAALSQGIETATILTVLGSIGLALALSLQTLLTNIVFGIKIAFTNSIKIGDKVEFKIPGLPSNIPIKGKVTDINLFNTKVSLENTNDEILIPNSLSGNSVMINSSIVYT